MQEKITAIIIAKNEADMLAACLATVAWCDQVLVLDSGSTDDTAKIAEQAGAKVVLFSHSSFARLRNEALKHVSTEWVFYLDADERVLPQLAREIQVHIETGKDTTLQLERKNVFFGQAFSAGGWSPDYVTRIFRKTSLRGWSGVVHESPEFEGGVVQLQIPLVHLTHRSVSDGLKKSVVWTALEAELLSETLTFAVTPRTVIRKGVMEFLRRGFFWRGYKDGTPGMMEALIQGINKMLVYLQVWELQQQPPIEQQYKAAEKEIADLWRKKS
ncbi:MAG: hypothetical protein COU67_00790 [Candidatus Pacebacteria bacterium CG10_big_fil_rev_8_21_14_0_10_44_54]|nr:glycosyltransferase family 2 protein [Candidatus Paceibacterota bacterium]PIR60806.1 MAG: hypothetical protein COU67_00790 [Candidatus Pacebacteria bacterium CG10_big_fil_rev_8_21_14_0_10_44_54]